MSFHKLYLEAKRAKALENSVDSINAEYHLKDKWKFTFKKFIIRWRDMILEKTHNLFHSQKSRDSCMN